MLIFAIDIGIVNMGVAYIHSLSPDNFKCLYAARVDITEFKCNSNCKFRHDAVMVDWISHFLVNHQNYIDNANVVLIERQPPMGHKCTEQLIYQAVREKAVLIHPRSLHAFFNMSRLTYEDRKKCIVSRAKHIFKDSSCRIKAVLNQNRVHDIADAMMMAVYYVKQHQVRHRILSVIHDNIDNDMKMEQELEALHFSKFAYVRNRKRHKAN